MFSRMYELSLEGKSYFSVLYNLALVILTAIVLGLLMSKVTDLLRKDDVETDTSDTDSERDRNA